MPQFLGFVFTVSHINEAARNRNFMRKNEKNFRVRKSGRHFLIYTMWLPDQVREVLSG